MAGLLESILPAIYSTGDTLKRNVRGLISDPAGWMSSLGQDFQTANQQRSEAIQGLLYPSVMQTPQDRQAAYGQMTDQAVNLMAPTVYHGSPHSFSAFDASRIGTGEGAQAYGHGLYLAESPAVAGEYANMNAKSPASPAQLLRLRDAAPKGSAEWAHYDALMQNGQSNLYKVDLPDSAVAKMLDWDKPLSQQAPEVQAALQSMKLRADKYGEDVYKDLIPNRGKAGATDMLRAQGITGIRYLDRGSRGAGQGTSNYVVFPGGEGLLNIMERNGQPVGMIK